MTPEQLDILMATCAQMTSGPWCCDIATDSSRDIEASDGSVLFGGVCATHEDAVGVCRLVNSADAMLLELSTLQARTCGTCDRDHFCAIQLAAESGPEFGCRLWCAREAVR
jgi:hypothetical protein